MKASELRELSIDDLAVKEKDIAEELFKLSFQHGIRPLENPAKLSQLKKDIAKVKTVASEKRRADSSS